MRPALMIVLGLFLYACLPSAAQDDDVSLGDLARAARKQKPADDQPVIDNDNLTIMMDKAEAERLDGKPVFSIDPSGKTFRMTSPDGTCSLSFDARAAALISTPYLSSDLPAYEVEKLEGAAAIHDGFLEVRLRNDTAWELKEIVVGLTLLNQSGAELQPARLISTIDAQTEARPPDATSLYHLKATSAAGATTIFRTVVSDELSEAKDWHWALVSARGIPPAATGTVAANNRSPASNGSPGPIQPAVPSATSSVAVTELGSSQNVPVQPVSPSANPPQR